MAPNFQRKMDIYIPSFDIAKYTPRHVFMTLPYSNRSSFKTAELELCAVTELISYEPSRYCPGLDQNTTCQSRTMFEPYFCWALRLICQTLQGPSNSGFANYQNDLVGFLRYWGTRTALLKYR
jgi:hypothetical protein